MNYEVRMRLEQLASDFPRYLQRFDDRVPFNKPGQREYHSETIKVRRDLISAAASVDDDRLMRLLWETLLAWGIGSRGSRLVPYPEFCRAIRPGKGEICSLDGLWIDDPSLNIDEVVVRLWNLVKGLNIVENDTKLVACSKALHHLLPDLIMPMDRQYTRVFFHCYGSQFQYGQRRFFEQAYRSLVQLAREVGPGQYVGSGWRTSRTKVLDNALIAYCQENRLSLL